jgi:hypothetical protein
MTVGGVEEGLWGVAKKYLIFIALTIWFHLFGPWAYADESLWVLFAFMGLFVGLILLGYRSGLKNHIIIKPEIAISNRVLFKALGVSLVTSLCIKGSVLINNFASGGGANLTDSIANAGKVYAEALSRNRGLTEVSLVGQIETLSGILTQTAIIGGFFYFSKMKPLLRILFWSLIGVIFLNAILFRGTQIAFGSMLIYGLSVASVISIRNRQPLLNWKLVSAIALMLFLFAHIQASRLEAYGVGIDNFPLNPLISIKKDHWFFIVFGRSTGFVFAIMTQYFSMGYYGLSLCLNLDFVWTHGLGSSMALSSYAHQYFGAAEQLQNSYPLRLEAINGWPALMYWQTTFPWLAGDFTWAGTLLLFCMLAYCYAISLKEAVNHHNFLSMMLVANLNIMWLFVPANNQLMQTRESTIAFLALLLLWSFFHRRFNRPLGEVGLCVPESGEGK